MDYRNILSVAEDKLGNIYPDVVFDMQELISSGSTGGEISSMVGKYLKDLEIKNREAYSIMEKDIQLYLFHCKKQGLYVQ